MAAFICHGHPLLDAIIDLVLERYRHILKQGAVFLDETDAGEDLRALFYFEHPIQDGRIDKSGNRRTVSRQLQFVEIRRDGNALNAGYAPYLDYRPLTVDETSLVASFLESQDWLRTDLEAKASAHAIRHLVIKHFNEVKTRRSELVMKTMAAVKERLTKEITYWDHRAEELKAQEDAGKDNARMNSAKARQRADDLTVRLQKRLEDLELERQLSPLPPVVIGGGLVVPKGLLERLKGRSESESGLFARETSQVERQAMAAVMATERSLGFIPRDVSGEKCGYDIESALPGTGRLRFIEVKGRIEGSETVTVTKNEILAAMNKPEDYILAVVLIPVSDQAGDADSISDGNSLEVQEGRTPHHQPHSQCRVCYVRQPFQREPDFGVTSVNYSLTELMARGGSSS